MDKLSEPCQKVKKKKTIDKLSEEKPKVKKHG